MGNFSLLGQYLFLYASVCKSKSTDLILRHLTVANTLVILSRGIPETMAAFGAEDFLSDIGCKLVFYVHRVGRGVSLSSTCLLSVFQAVTISPRKLMLCASGSMVLMLYRHKQQVRHMHKTSVSSRSSPVEDEVEWKDYAASMEISSLQLMAPTQEPCGTKWMGEFPRQHHTMGSGQAITGTQSSPVFGRELGG
ncbi:vomeronasal type-1 receptor 3-like [Erethizon dorsatum]